MKLITQATGPNSGDFAHVVGWNTKAGPSIGGALGGGFPRGIAQNFPHAPPPT